MRVDDDHMYHGAALIQIAEDPQFTAINSFKLAAGVSRSAYRINDDIGVYLKYASKPTPAYREYLFTFQKQHLAELAAIAKATEKVFAALVCVKARQSVLPSVHRPHEASRRSQEGQGSHGRSVHHLGHCPGQQELQGLRKRPRSQKHHARRAGRHQPQRLSRRDLQMTAVGRPPNHGLDLWAGLSRSVHKAHGPRRSVAKSVRPLGA